MQAIEYAAYISVGRGCAFAGLAVLCVMLGLSFEPVLAAQIGGVLCLAVAVILIAFAYAARTRNYKHTEVWLILPKDHRPPESIAQKVIGGALRETYLWFAQQALLFAVGLLAASLTLSLFLGVPT